MRGNIVVEIGNSNENENARLIEAEIGRMRDGSTKRCTYCTVEMRYFKFFARKIANEIYVPLNSN